MKISELIVLLQKQQKLYGNFEIKVRDHQTGRLNTVDYPFHYRWNVPGYR